MPRHRTRAACLTIAAAALTALACSDAHVSDADASGKLLAQRYCQSCHLLPDPSLLDRPTWQHWVLPRMGRRLGLKDVGDTGRFEPVEGGIGGELIRAAGIYPDSARLARRNWDRLVSYYLREAPTSLPAAVTPPVTGALPGFNVHIAEFHIASPMITLVHVDSARSRIWVGDGTIGHSTLTVLDGRNGGRAIDTFPIPSPLSHLQLSANGDTLRALFMGKLHPSDAPLGSAALITSWRPNGAPTIAWQVDSLQRPVYASWADLDGDGVEDVLVSEFGNLTGRLAWYERVPGGDGRGAIRRHLLGTQPGALNTYVGDVDGDKRADVLALTAQADEGVSLFRGRRGGGFVHERLLRFPPSYGSTSMQLADVDGDGHPDIVYTNGDNGDYPSPPKPYHGIRIFLNDGQWHFREAYFFAMPGAFKAIARDFDGDGDVDIAAIAFYPDYTASTPLSFVYLENTGNMRFKAWTFPEANRGRWLTMDAGDVDGDGDADLVLGSFAQLDALGDRRELSAGWRRPDAPTIIILENVGGSRSIGRRR